MGVLQVCIRKSSALFRPLPPPFYFALPRSNNYRQNKPASRVDRAERYVFHDTSPLLDPRPPECALWRNLVPPFSDKPAQDVSMNGGDTHVQLALLIARDTEGAYKTLDHSERYRDDRSAHAQWRLRGGFNGRQGPRSSRARSGFDVVERPRVAARKIC